MSLVVAELPRVEGQQAEVIRPSCSTWVMRSLALLISTGSVTGTTALTGMTYNTGHAPSPVRLCKMAADFRLSEIQMHFLELDSAVRRATLLLWMRDI